PHSSSSFRPLHGCLSGPCKRSLWKSYDERGPWFLRCCVRFRRWNIFPGIFPARDSWGADCGTVERTPLDCPHPVYLGHLHDFGRFCSNRTAVLCGPLLAWCCGSWLLPWHHRLPDSLVCEVRSGSSDRRLHDCRSAVIAVWCTTVSRHSHAGLARLARMAV